MPQNIPEPKKPHDIKSLSDRELIEAVYRGIYGEEPIHPGLARRVSRLETAFFLLAALVVGFEGIPSLLALLAK